jgi:hypothetical protein
VSCFVLVHTVEQELCGFTALCRDLLCYSVTEWLCYSVTVTVLLHSAEILCYSVTECVTALCRDLLCYSVTEWMCYSVTG